MDKIYNYETLINDQVQCKYKIKVESKEIERRVGLQLENIALTAKLDGFRKGKVPSHIIKQRYFSGILQEVATELIDEISTKILEEEPRQACSAETKLIEYPDANSDTLKLEYELSFEILGEVPAINHETISLVKKEAILDKEDIESEISRIMSEAVHYEQNSEKKAEEEDKILIHYSGKIRGKPFRGSSGEVEFIVGKHLVPESIEKSVIGMTESEKKESVSVTFPDNYQNKLLSGRTIEMDIQVQKIFTPKKFEGKEEFAKFTKFENYEKMSEHYGDYLKNESQRMADLLLRKDLLDFLDNEYSFEIPDSLIKQEEEAIKDSMKEFEQKEAEDDGNKKTDALRRVKLGMLLVRFGEDEKIKVDGNDMMNQIGQEYGHNQNLFSEAMVALRKNKRFARSIHGKALENKVLAHLVSKINLTTQNLKFSELKEVFENV